MSAAVTEIATRSRYVIDASSLMATVAPRELKQGFNESYAQVKKLWKDLLKKGPDPKKGQELKGEKMWRWRVPWTSRISI